MPCAVGQQMLEECGTAVPGHPKTLIILDVSGGHCVDYNFLNTSVVLHIAKNLTPNLRLLNAIYL
jgi:hypothetical protein